VPALRVDYALRGVALAPGRHVVEMIMVTPALDRGAMVSLLALGAVAAVTLVRSRRRRTAARAG
jgi:hypothetical protein